MFEKEEVQQFKGALVDLRQISIENSLKMMKNAFYFTLKAFLVLKKFMSCIFGCVEKRPDQKDKVNFEVYAVTALLTNNYNTPIAQYLIKATKQ